MTDHIPVQMLGPDQLPPLPDSSSPRPGPAPATPFGGGQTPPNGIPRFELVSVKHVDGTYHNVEFVNILTSGDKNAMPRHKVTDEIRRMYAPWYEHWRRGLEMAPSGTPLEMWPQVTPAQIAELKSKNIFTLEQLVGVADSNLHQIPMGRTIRNQASEWLKVKKESDGFENMRREKDAMKDGMTMLEQQIASLREELQASKVAKAEPPKRGPGRPPKTVEPEAA